MASRPPTSAAGFGLSDDRIVVATSGEPMVLGAYEVTLIESKHSPPDRYPGVITEPVVPPVKASAYKCGEAWSVLIRHQPTNHRLLVQGSAGFVEGALAGQQADVVYLGVGQLGLLPEQYMVDYWNEVVRSVGARRVVLIHWDDFFRPLTEPLRALTVRRRRSGRDDARAVPAGRRRRDTPAPAHGVGARKPLGLSLIAGRTPC